MQYILDLLLKQILGQTFILIGLIVFVGYIAMKQKWSKALMGALKAATGVLVMSMGSGALIGNFNKLLAAVTNATGITGAGLNTYPTMVDAFSKMDTVLGGEAATWGIYTLLVGFVFNLLFVALRKYTKISAVYLTGNAMLVQTGISAFIVWKFLNTGMLATVLIAGFITALYWGIGASLLIKPTKAITNADFTVAHQQMFHSYAATKIAPMIGNPEDDIEKKKMPESLNFLQDNIIATLLVMLISVIVIFLVIGGDGVAFLRGPEGFNQGGLGNDLILILWIAITLTANVTVLLSGVRMFVGEIMASFKGISERLLPGAVAGVDCAAIFAFAPKSVVLGLIGGAVGQILGVILLIVFKSPIFLVPGFIPLFFDNATVAVYANKFGGWKAALALTVTNGLIQIFGSALAISMLGLSWWQGSADYATVWVAVIAFFKFLGQMLGIPVAG